MKMLKIFISQKCRNLKKLSPLTLLHISTRSSRNRICQKLYLSKFNENIENIYFTKISKFEEIKSFNFTTHFDSFLKESYLSKMVSL